MELDRLALKLRPRGPWEAMDLGFSMLREWWVAAFAAWIAVFGLVAAVLFLVFRDNLPLALFLLWWLKPLFDRAVLHVLGGAVFGSAPSLAGTLRALPRAAAPGLFASLTLYRFDLARSFNLPVWHLERLTGGAARARAKALHRRVRGHAVWLTLACLHFELVILVGTFGLIGVLTPEPYDANLDLWYMIRSFSELPPWQQWLVSGLYVIAVSTVEPFYVAAGYALYLNRRTLLEAWDIELALRRLDERIARAHAPGAVVAAVLVAALLLAVPGGAPLAAAGKSAKEEIQKILKEPEFEQHREVTELRYTGRGLGLEPGKEKEPEKGFDWTNFGRFLADLGRALMWVAVAVLCVAALYAAARYAHLFRRLSAADGYTPPDSLFGVDIRPDSLPADIVAAALALAESGRAREALSLLYRGALSTLVHRDRVQLAASDTEGDCLRRMSAKCAPDAVRYFTLLVTAWQSAAYAGRTPGRDAIDALARAWPAHFGPGARA